MHFQNQLVQVYKQLTSVYILIRVILSLQYRVLDPIQRSPWSGTLVTGEMLSKDLRLHSTGVLVRKMLGPSLFAQLVQI